MVFGFTKHGETLPKHGLTCKQGVFGGLERVVRGQRGVRGGVAAADGHQRVLARQTPPMAGRAGFLAGSVGQGVFVVRHRVHIVTRFVGVWPRAAGGGRSGGRIVPGTQMTQDFLDHLGDRL